MVAISSTLPSAPPNRRRRVRHRIQTPAYAIFTGESQGAMLDLHEIVDISEDGMSIQCHTPLEVQSRLKLCLDLADCPQQIYTTGQVVWSNPNGRAGFHFSDLPPDSLSRLREWLFVNVMAGVANGEAEIAQYTVTRNSAPPRPNHTDTLAAISAVQRQVETLSSDLKSALQLVAERSQALVRAAGIAIALADTDPDFMLCRASSGNAPPIGARLQLGSGLSGDCVKNAVPLRCDDSEVDARVDPDSCRALGIRSILAVPVRAGDKSVGLIEAFSPHPNTFTEADTKTLQRFSETVLDAANRAARAENLPLLGPPPAPRFSAPAGSVLFASANEQEDKPAPEEKGAAGITLPRSQLIILVCALATTALALGWGLAPWLQSDAAPWLQSKLHSHSQTQLPTVLASSQPPKLESPSNPAVETASLDQLRQMAAKGDPAAQNSLGLRYATGEGVVLNEREAVNWFTKAAEQGNVAAQSKLASIYYSGRGVRKDPNRAYFWIVVARASGDEASKTLAPFVAALLPRSQVSSIELDADRWLQQHRPHAKPAAGLLKAKS
jgi:putative methionine-R-sulfoxide reductase with GAF domain